MSEIKILIVYFKGWLTWSFWSACSVDCGGGTYDRSRQCQNLEKGVIVDATECPGGNGASAQNGVVCNDFNCPAGTQVKLNKRQKPHFHDIFNKDKNEGLKGG